MSRFWGSTFGVGGQDRLSRARVVGYPGKDESVPHEKARRKVPSDSSQASKFPL